MKMLRRSTLRRVWFALLTLVLVAVGLQGALAQERGRAGFRPPGLQPLARHELAAAGVNKYVGQFLPSGSEEIGDWTKYTFDTQGGDGPVCISGTELSVFHQERDPRKLMIVLDGGGACWQGFYFCDVTADSNPPAGGIFADSGAGIANPLADWSKVFVSYCDGSVFSGDNTVTDAAFPGGVRHHRGLRNLTAALDLARELHPAAQQVLLGGISAGGFGVAGFAPAVYRFVFPVAARLYVLNDSGPALTNPALVSQVNARVNDWAYTQFYPESCTDCDPFNQPAVFVEWTLDHDNGYKGALYSTDGDATIRFFLSIPTAAAYRSLLLNTHNPINAAHPDRYKRFIRAGSTAHTAIAGNLFYTATANGIPLYQWVTDFVNGAPGWVDNVE
jgi:pectinacetylesterase